jgi:hypothetical protein
MVMTRRKLRSEAAPTPAPKELSPDEESESEEEQEQEEVEEKDSEEQDSSEDSEEEEEEQEEEGSDEEEDNEQEKRAAANSLEINPVASANGEQCTFDLRNLLAMNVHQVSTAALYSTKAKMSTSEDKHTIAPTGLGVSVNEDYILEKATDGCAQLLGALWQLPIERSDAGPMVFLPSYDEIKIPRALVSFHCRRRSHALWFLVDRRLAAHFIPPRRSSHCLPYNSYHFALTASSTPETRDKVGEICQRKGHPIE